jgi:hypothetical protein
MPWTPKFQAIQEEALVTNVLTIIERDFKDALDYFYPIEAALDSSDPRYLHDFRERTLGQIVKNDFPCIAIAPNRNASSPDADEGRLIERVEIDAYLGVVDDSPANVTERIMRYVGTVDAVLRSARKADYFVNMSVQTFGFVLEMEHVYGPIGTDKVALFRGAQVQLTITVNER